VQVHLTEGKRKRLQSVADSRGVIAALAIDRRSAMQKLFSKAMNVEFSEVPDESIGAV
jgi:tagatose-1,6-bisphosphate aldolase